MIPYARLLALLLALVCVGARAEHGAASGTGTKPLALVAPSPGRASVSRLGFAVATAGDTIAAGAPDTTVDGRKQAGAVHLFDTRTGALRHTLVSPTPQAEERFGFAVAMDDGQVLVGAPHGSVDRVARAGNAYLFDATTGALLQRFHEPEPAEQHELGFAVSLDRGIAAIGAPGATARGVAGAGLVYVFDTSDGTLRHRLATREPRAGEAFARALDVTGRALAVGAPHAVNGDLAEAGAVDVFDVPTGRWLARLRSPAPRSGGHFGTALDIKGRTILIGAPYPDGARNIGRAFLLETRTGRIVRVFRAPGQTDVRERFGSAVARRGTAVLVGAPDAPYGTQRQAGAAYAFDAASGALRGVLRAPTPTPGSQYGIAVALTRGARIVGAQAAPGGGAVYVSTP